MRTPDTRNMRCLTMNCCRFRGRRLTSENKYDSSSNDRCTHVWHSFNGWGLTVFDSLDTMWIMGLDDMFRDSLEVVSNSTFFLRKVR